MKEENRMSRTIESKETAEDVFLDRQGQLKPLFWVCFFYNTTKRKGISSPCFGSREVSHGIVVEPNRTKPIDKPDQMLCYHG